MDFNNGERIDGAVTMELKMVLSTFLSTIEGLFVVLSSVVVWCWLLVEGGRENVR